MYCEKVYKTFFVLNKIKIALENAFKTCLSCTFKAKKRENKLLELEPKF
jgi:hypothetical protein